MSRANRYDYNCHVRSDRDKDNDIVNVEVVTWHKRRWEEDLPGAAEDMRWGYAAARNQANPNIVINQGEYYTRSKDTLCDLWNVRESLYMSIWVMFILL